MSRIAYVDGRYVRQADACVHVEDRGLQFADSVYEVCAVSRGRLMDEKAHLARLERSLAAIAMDLPIARAALQIAMRETVRRNRLKDGLLYLQITRGTHPRDHAIPANARGTVIMTARRLDPAAILKRREEGVAIVTTPDLRWLRRDIKSTGLLPNVLAKAEARERGAYEAWLVDEDGFVTEGTSTNAWIVAENGHVVTRALSPLILPGVTRAMALTAAADDGVAVEERSFSREEAYRAREAFLSSATGHILPVVQIDGRRIGDGRPGPMAARMQTLYLRKSQAEDG